MAVQLVQAGTLPAPKCAEVDLSGKGLTDVSASELPSQNVETLVLARNQFHLGSTLSIASISGSLLGLDLSQNEKMSRLPEALASLSNLKELDASSCGLADLPAWIGQLQQLRTLRVCSNELQELPAEIGSCHALLKLQVSQNRIKMLPSTLCSCTQLEVLDVSSNQLCALQGQVFEWRKLRELDVSYNPDLQMLPSAVGWLDLQVLNVEGTPRLRIPKAVSERPGCQVPALLSYLQILGEQHRLVDNHLGKFAVSKRVATFADGDQTHEVVRTDPKRSLSARPFKAQDYSTYNSAAEALVRSKASRLLDMRCCNLQTLSDIDMLADAAPRVVDLRYNELASIPAAILTLGKVIILNAAHNCISSLADEVDMPSLSVLNVSFNELALLPSLAKAGRLQQLYAANNSLSDLPASVATLPIVDLLISENNFRKVPACICQLTAIVKLSLACNQLTELPAAIGNLTTLSFLDVSFNQLQGLPKELAKLDGLSAFNASFNDLGLANQGAMPPVLFELTSLKELNLDYSGITKISPALGNLRQLEGLQMEGCELEDPWVSLYQRDPILLVCLNDATIEKLDLSKCDLCEVPTALTTLVNLSTLNLSHNSLTTLPRSLSALTSLTSLQLAANPLEPHLALMLLKGTDSEGADPILNIIRQSVSQLCLSAFGFPQLPPEVLWHSHHLIKLDLSSNQLTSLPDSLAELTVLQVLNLDKNHFIVLPAPVCQLPELQVLQIGQNDLKSLPASVSRLQHLKMLSFSRNEVSELPEAVCQMTSLLGMSFSNNRITELPARLGDLTRLKVLDAGHNLLAVLPPTFAALAALKVLRLAHNKLTWVPAGLSALTGLRELHLVDNPVTGGQENTLATTRAAVAELLLRCGTAPVPNSPPAPAPNSLPAPAPKSLPMPAPAPKSLPVLAPKSLPVVRARVVVDDKWTKAGANLGVAPLMAPALPATPPLHTLEQTLVAVVAQPRPAPPKTGARPQTMARFNRVLMTQMQNMEKLTSDLESSISQSHGSEVQGP